MDTALGPDSCCDDRVALDGKQNAVIVADMLIEEGTTHDGAIFSFAVVAHIGVHEQTIERNAVGIEPGFHDRAHVLRVGRKNDNLEAAATHAAYDAVRPVGRYRGAQFGGVTA